PGDLHHQHLAQAAKEIGAILGQLSAGVQFVVKQIFLSLGYCAMTRLVEACVTWRTRWPNPMASVFGEQERSMLRARVVAGLDRVRQQGKRLGRPKVSPKVENAIRTHL